MHMPEENHQTSRSKLSVRRLMLRSVAGGSARLSNIVGAGKSAWITIDDMPVQVRILPGAHALSEAGSRMRMESVHGPLTVAPGDALVRLLTGIDIPSAPESAQLDRWIASVAVSGLPAEWQDLFGMRAVLPAECAQDEETLTLQLLPEQGNWSFTAHLCGTFQTLCALAQAEGWTDILADHLLATDDLTVSRPIVIGSTAVRLDRLSALTRGDLVLLDKARFRPDGEGWITFGDDLAMHASLLDSGTDLQLQFNGWSTTMEDREDIDDMDDLDEMNEMDDSDPDEEREPEDNATTALDDLTVMLTFEIGTVERTVAELKALTAGKVIQLPAALPPTVVVRCRNKEIARGELVEVEGRLAVQITETGRVP
ncbi:FliM/FliN family flagellar motor switch protein [Noviherbaspirillum saxi]|uniref:Flagellar motor switch protein FliN-like C-terminal domain-containing protein n=1 Tax=Noviherbaspirillum saxi TaxID=2320863 RepID=A0A3A3FFQ6_9BURK|nr:FliM/FliN family flagellar motor switch protein [Noviherbaspirillum saxi]RJF92171.1 hypothetical protein D3871_26375 [Noviherbaspirillum saxi]